MKTDALILGGGMAGLSAAYEIALRGYKTIIVDEAWNLGGQLLSQTQYIEDMPQSFSGLRGFEIAAKLRDRLQELPVGYLLQHEVVGLFQDGSVGVSNGQEIKRIAADSIIVATGAAEKAVPFPGWTLPGIMTVGAAQILINREWVCPGKTGVIIGSSNMALEIARQLQAVGINILGVVEKAAEVTARNKTTVNSFTQTGITSFLNTKVVAASGRGKVQAIELQTDDGVTAKYPVDFVCIDGGREPIPEVFSILNCRFAYNEELGGRVPGYDFDFQTSVKGVFVAGQSAGITDHAGVFLTGVLAGIGAAAFLTKGAKENFTSDKEYYRHELEKFESDNLPLVWQARMAHSKASIEKNSNF